MEDWSKKIWDMFEKQGVADAPSPPPVGASTEELIKYMERLTKEPKK